MAATECFAHGLKEELQSARVFLYPAVPETIGKTDAKGGRRYAADRQRQTVHPGRGASYLPDGAVVIDGDTVQEVGSLADMKAKYPAAEFVDARGQIILPGLINAHTHIYSGLARCLAITGNHPTNFLEVLEGTWWNIDRHLTLDGTRACAYATVLDCIRDGVTTIFDHHASFREIPGSLFAIQDVFGRWASGPACATRSASGTAWRSAARPSGERRLCQMVQGAGRRHDPRHVRRPRPVHPLGPDL